MSYKYAKPLSVSRKKTLNTQRNFMRCIMRLIEILTENKMSDLAYMIDNIRMLNRAHVIIDEQMFSVWLDFFMDRVKGTLHVRIKPTVYSKKGIGTDRSDDERDLVFAKKIKSAARSQQHGRPVADYASAKKMLQTYHISNNAIKILTNPQDWDIVSLLHGEYEFPAGFHRGSQDRAIAESAQPNTTYQYIGNCTNDHMAPYLDDMMSNAVAISYTKLANAVGVENLALSFPDYNWGRKPGELRLRNDACVTYYKSTFRGWPCYYVRQSGVEFVFVPDDYDPDDVPGDFRPIKTDYAQITETGELVPSNANRQIRAIFNLEPHGKTLRFSQSSAANRESARTMIDYVLQNKFTTIVEDGQDPQTPDEFIDWLKTYL